jgi:hypothetical protein
MAGLKRYLQLEMQLEGESIEGMSPEGNQVWEQGISMVKQISIWKELETVTVILKQI